MNLSILKILLWQTDGHIRALDFEPNKVNVITGESGTGKSSIIGIIDYCLMGSEPQIAEMEINENVLWYGLHFKLNDKLYTIARMQIGSPGASKHCYFSSIGQIPDQPEPQFQVQVVKSILEKEFSIDPDLTFSYGGDYISVGSKISFRYFLLFNSQKQATLISEDYLFDKIAKEGRYKEALQRIFDLAIGAETLENIAFKDRLDKLQKEYRRLIAKTEKLSRANSLFKEEMTAIIAKAKHLQIIDTALDFDNALEELSRVRDSDNLQEISVIDPSLRDELTFKRDTLKLRIGQLKTFVNEYKRYKDLAKKDLDSLAPINFLRENIEGLILERETYTLVDQLGTRFKEIKKYVTSRENNPVEIDLKERIRNLENELSKIQQSIDGLPDESGSALAASTRERLFFLGELSGKLSVFLSSQNEDEIKFKAEGLEQEIEAIRTRIDPTNSRDLIRDLLNDCIEYHLKDAPMGKYSQCKPFFNFKEKVLDLRESRKAKIHPFSRIGSASNYVFLHVASLLGLHELAASMNVPFIAPYLILDQVSSPYFVVLDKETGARGFRQADDRKKLNAILRILNDFITKVNQDHGREFQIILLEHIPEQYWKDERLENFSLVDMEFRDGHALVNLRKGEQS